MSTTYSLYALEKNMDIKKADISSVPKGVKDRTKNISRTPEIQNIKLVRTPVVKTKSVSRCGKCFLKGRCKLTLTN